MPGLRRLSPGHPPAVPPFGIFPNLTYTPGACLESCLEPAPRAPVIGNRNSTTKLTHPETADCVGGKGHMRPELIANERRRHERRPCSLTAFCSVPASGSEMFWKGPV